MSVSVFKDFGFLCDFWANPENILHVITLYFILYFQICLLHK